MNKLIDISVNLTQDLAKWPNSVGFTSYPVLEIGKDEAIANLSTIEMDVHCGTHIDAPLHFLEDGLPMSSISLTKLMGKCYVVECNDVKVISAKEVGLIPSEANKILFKTSNSALWANEEHKFEEHFVGLNAEASHALAERDFDLVGVDYLSIQGFFESPETHRILLRKNVVLLEGINLTDVSQGWYQLYCLPLKIPHLEASPCRAILMKE